MKSKTFLAGGKALPAAALLLVTMILAPAVRAQTYRVLYTFGTNPGDGGSPYAGLTPDSAGNFYGITTYGGNPACTFGCGTVFQLTPNSDGTWAESVIYSFTGGDDGSMPRGELALDAAGNVYGTTVWGGPFGWMGVIFKLSPSAGTWDYSQLMYFNGGNGIGPTGPLNWDESGNLYGATWLGGDLRACSNGCGTVYQLKSNLDGSWSHNLLYSFEGSRGGLWPYGGVTFDKAGNLYGTTAAGGDPNACGGGCGVIFKLDSGEGWKESVLHTFRGRPANWSYAPVAFDAAGNLFGTTQNSGGAGGGPGTVFELAPQQAGWTYRVHAFSGGNDAAFPAYGKLAGDSKGNLYGTTQAGGTYGNGTVFRMRRDAHGRWRERVLYNFTGGSDGGWPLGGLMLANGKLYGTASGGGYGGGVVFEITP